MSLTLFLFKSKLVFYFNFNFSFNFSLLFYFGLFYLDYFIFSLLSFIIFITNLDNFMNQTGYSSMGPKCFGTSKRSNILYSIQLPLLMFEMMISLDQVHTTPPESIAQPQQNGNSEQAHNVTHSYKNILAQTPPHMITPQTPNQLKQHILYIHSQNLKLKMQHVINKMKIVELIIFQTAILINIKHQVMDLDIFKKEIIVLLYLHLILIRLRKD